MPRVKNHKYWIIRLLYFLSIPHTNSVLLALFALYLHTHFRLWNSASYPPLWEMSLWNGFLHYVPLPFQSSFQLLVRSPSTLISQSFYFLWSSLTYIRYELLSFFVYNILGVTLLKAEYILVFLCFIHYNEHFLNNTNDFYYWLVKRNWRITSFQCPDFS